jgi:hypothetical protein
VLNQSYLSRSKTARRSGQDEKLKGTPVKSSKKIVFFVASFSSIEATAPLGILAISTPLLNAGYDIRIIDSTITPNYKKRIMEEVKDALCLGISVVTNDPRDGGCRQDDKEMGP